MKLIPILFNDLMIPPIYNNIKTNTRRLMSPQPDKWMTFSAIIENGLKARFFNKGHKHLEIGNGIYDFKSRFGQPGDVLWVRETYYQYGHWKKAGKTKKGNQKWAFVPESDEICFENNKPDIFFKSRDKTVRKRGHEFKYWYKRNARFMPLKYARLFLLVKEIDVQRIRDISKADAIAEGIQSAICSVTGKHYRDYLADASGYGDPEHDFPWAKDAISSFQSLWIKIHGEQSWNNNEWVWKIVFERTIKPDIFYEKMKLV